MTWLAHADAPRPHFLRLPAVPRLILRSPLYGEILPQACHAPCKSWALGVLYEYDSGIAVHDVMLLITLEILGYNIKVGYVCLPLRRCVTGFTMVKQM